jgi:hypothetical protein
LVPREVEFGFGMVWPCFSGLPLFIGSLEWFGAALSMLCLMHDEIRARKILETAGNEADIPVGNNKESS